MYERLGRYDLKGELGRGSMGVVYKAYDPLIDRYIAIKTIDLKLLDEDGMRVFEQYFEQEARAAGKLNHPNVVTIHDAGRTGDLAYIAMELVVGEELKRRIAGGHPLQAVEALDIAIQVANGLDYAAQHGIVHRDIKPSNIMILDDRRVKIVDFGVARMGTARGTPDSQQGILGTPAYLSPEQIKGETVDARSDIFALGIVLYQMLTGVLPFSGEHVMSTLYQILNETPPLPSQLRPEVPDMLDPIVARCLAKSPLDRYPDAHALAQELQACQARLQQAQAGLDLLRNLRQKGLKRIHQLVYVSSPVGDIEMEELKKILTKSQYKNLRLDLSGLLIFHRGRFMQLLEGSEQYVKSLYDTIRQDPRHTDLEIIFEADSNSRSMPSWAMGFSVDDDRSSQIGEENFYITPEMTRLICASMDGEIGRLFNEFIRS